MASIHTVGWSRRMVAEIQILATGLFVTAIMARLIALLGFDDRSALPTPMVLNSDIVGFIAFVVSDFKVWRRFMGGFRC